MLRQKYKTKFAYVHCTLIYSEDLDCSKSVVIILTVT